MIFRHRSIRRIKNHTYTTSQSKVTDSNVKMEWKKNSKRGSTVGMLVIGQNPKLIVNISLHEKAKSEIALI